MPRFTTHWYEHTNGKRPYGHAIWAFRDRHQQGEHKVAFSPPMNFTEAKQWAREALPDATVIEVCP